MAPLAAARLDVSRCPLPMFALTFPFWMKGMVNKRDEIDEGLSHHLLMHELGVNLHEHCLKAGHRSLPHGLGELYPCKRQTTVPLMKLTARAKYVTKQEEEDYYI